MRKRNISFSPPDIGEEEIRELIKTLQSGWITTGPRVKLFESRLAAYIHTGKTEFSDISDQKKEQYKGHVACLSSGSAAEEMNLRLFGIEKGDEVLVPAYTYTATAAAAIHCGATVKFVDIQKDGDTYTHMPEMDYDALEAAITPNTKAIIPVDIGGAVCNYERIFEIVERKKHLFHPCKKQGSVLEKFSSHLQSAIGRVAVIADCAHSLGGSRLFRGKKKHCGEIADLSSFSFHAVKNLTTAEGGASVWKTVDGISDTEFYYMLQLLSLHGQSKDAASKMQEGNWEYDVIGPWYKCNMTDLTAALGLKQLDRYGNLLERRRQIQEKYDSFCISEGISYMKHQSPQMDSSMHLYLIRLPGFNETERNAVIKKMALYGVSTNVHYKPLPLMSAYGKDCSKFPNAYEYYQNALTLPFHTLLRNEDIDYICDTLKRSMQEVKGGGK